MVNPAALLATSVPRDDAYVVEVNPERTVITPRANAALRGTATQILPALLETGA
jgi:NAD-dependent SIR2 family protein deacetylase